MNLKFAFKEYNYRSNKKVKIISDPLTLLEELWKTGQEGEVYFNLYLPNEKIPGYNIVGFLRACSRKIPGFKAPKVRYYRYSLEKHNRIWNLLEQRKFTALKTLT